MRKFGFQVHAASPALVTALRTFSPPTLLVLAASPSDSIDLAAGLLSASPAATVIYRSWSLFSPGDADHVGQILQHDPKDLFSAYAVPISIFGDRLVYHVMNETGHSDHATWKKYCEWQAAAVREANRRGLRLCVFNQGPGTPGLSYDDAHQYWLEAAPVYAAIAEGGYRSILGFHDYFAGGAGSAYPSPSAEFPYLIGRHTLMQKAAQQLGYDITRLKVVITEYGWAKNLPSNPFSTDEPGDSIAYYAKHLSPSQMASVMAQHHELYYDSDPAVLGTCHFIVGRSASPYWADYDLLAFPDLLNALQPLVTHEELPTVTPTAPILYRTNARLNVRPAASTAPAAFAVLDIGTSLVTDAYTDAYGYRWRKLAGLSLWVAEYSLSSPADLYLTPLSLSSAPDLIPIIQQAEELSSLADDLVFALQTAS